MARVDLLIMLGNATVIKKFFVVAEKLGATDAEACLICIAPKATHTKLGVVKYEESVTTRWRSGLSAHARTNVEEACDVNGTEWRN